MPSVLSERCFRLLSSLPGSDGRGLSAADVAAVALEAARAGRRVFSAVVTRSSGGAVDGKRWWAAGEFEGGAPVATGGSLGSASLERAVAAALPFVFPARDSGGACSREFEYEDARGRPATATVYVELHGPPPQMVIVGGGHVAVPLARLGVMLGLRVEVLDDRPEFAEAGRFPGAVVRTIDFRDPFADTRLAPADHVVLVTRGHRFDYECLMRLLAMERPPAYIGMIGSRRRVRATHEQLAREGFAPEQMKQVRAPVGLDLGGQTPAEIAVSVAAEIVMFHGGGSGAPLCERERVVERFFERGEARAARQREAGSAGA